MGSIFSGKSSVPEAPTTYETIINGIKEKKYKNIIFLTGAGISVSSGIPDFRSPETGIYHQIESYQLDYPEQMFQLDYFKNHPEPFYCLAKEFVSKEFLPVASHFFQVLVNKQGLLKKVYTQNVDGLELDAGLPSDKLLQAHGHLFLFILKLFQKRRTAHCVSKSHKIDADTLREHIKNGQIMKCPQCGSNVKPDVVFFGEGLPWSFYWNVLKIKSCDLAIIMGTSLVVQPFASLTSLIPNKAPVLLINRDFSTQNFNKSNLVWMDGDLDENVLKIVKDLQWEEEFQQLQKNAKGSKL